MESTDKIEREKQIIRSPRIKGGLTATTIEAFEKWIRDLPQDQFPVNVRISGAPEAQFNSANELSDKHDLIRGQLSRTGFIDFYRTKSLP